ncbi:MAG: hypothetical protein U0T78_04060 [Cloacibacterium normanense]
MVNSHFQHLVKLPQMVMVTDGFIKVIFDAKYGEWLGCHMIGDGVGFDMVAEAVVARKLETTGHEIIKSI